MTKHQSLDVQIANFIYNRKTIRKIINPEKYNYKTIHQQQENLNSIFIAALMDCVTKDPHFLIKQISLANRLVFIVTENHQKLPDNQSITQAHLIKDYLTPFLINFQPIDFTKTSCSFDGLNQTWTLTTNIPTL